MLRPEETIERVYLYRKPIDMRKQRTGLAALVQEVIKVDPFQAGPCSNFKSWGGFKRRRQPIRWIGYCESRACALQAECQES